MLESKLFELTYSYPKYSEEMHIVHSSFFLGVFSSVEKVKEAIEFYSDVPGFSDNPNAFLIKPINLINHSVVYQVGISYIAEHEINDVEEILGYFETEEAAKEEAENSHLYRCFKDYFIINSITVDKMEWTEGFTQD